MKAKKWKNREVRTEILQKSYLPRLPILLKKLVIYKKNPKKPQTMKYRENVFQLWKKLIFQLLKLVQIFTQD